MIPANSRERPQPGALGFDQRLMTAERLLELAGRHPLRISPDAEGLPTLYLDCGQCGKAVDHLTDKAGGRYVIEPLQLLANVLRHQVMRHDLSLSGGNHDERPGPDTGAGGVGIAGAAGPGRDPGPGRAGYPADRPAGQTADPGGIAAAAGGDRA